jgi:hypothetical protein
MRTDVYLESVDLLKLLFLLLTQSVRTHSFYYVEQTKAAHLLNKCLKKVGIHSFTKIDFSRFSRKLENGASLLYKKEELTAKIVKDWFAHYGASQVKSPYSNFNDEWQQIVKTFLTMQIRETVGFICLIENSLHQDHTRKTKIIIDAVPLANSFLPYFNLSTSISVKIWPYWKWSILVFPFPGYVLYSFLWCFFSVIVSKIYRDNLTTINNKTRIFEEYWLNIFYRYPHSGHLFWFPQSGIDPDRVTLYFDRHDSPCSDSSRQQIQNYGMKWIDLNRRMSYSISPFSLLKAASQIHFPRRWNQQEIGLWAIQIYFIYWTEWYRNILRKNNVKVVHQHQECSHIALCLALATRLEDGIFVWNHWSVDHYPISYFDAGFADLVFSWGPYNDGYFNCHQYNYQYMIQTGLVSGDNFVSGDEQRGQKIRNTFPTKVKFILTLFDSSHDSYDVFSTTAMLIEFYEQMFALMKLKPDWGLIIKSKGISFKRIAMHCSIASSVKQLFSEERFVLLDGLSRVVPAAYAADVCLCFDINSAGIISGLAGRKTIHWDFSGALNHPIYYLGGKGTIIFRKFEEVKMALEKIAGGDYSVGDHSKWLTLFDPFRDGKGPERAGKVIAAFLDGVDAGKTRDQALKDAVDEYAEQWGDDKVTVKGQVPDHEGNQIWKQAREDIQSVCEIQTELIKE